MSAWSKRLRAGHGLLRHDRQSADHAFLSASNGGALQDLGTLGGTQSAGSGVNASGQVVGFSYLAGEATYDAFLYSGGVMTDLNNLIAPGSGLTLTERQSVSATMDTSRAWHGRERQYRRLPAHPKYGGPRAIEPDHAQRGRPDGAGILRPPPTRESRRPGLTPLPRPYPWPRSWRSVNR